MDDNLELRSPLVAFPRRQHDHHFASSTGSRRPSRSEFLTHLAQRLFPPRWISPSSFLSDRCHDGSSTFSPLIDKCGRISFPVLFARDHIATVSWKERKNFQGRRIFSSTWMLRIFFANSKVQSQLKFFFIRRRWNFRENPASTSGSTVSWFYGAVICYGTRLAQDIPGVFAS